MTKWRITSSKRMYIWHWQDWVMSSTLMFLDTGQIDSWLWWRGCDAGLTDPGPLEIQCLGAGGPGVTHHGMSTHQASHRQPRVERERSRAGSRAKHYIRTRDGELYTDRTVLVTRRTISIALNLFCNQGIKCSSWGSMAAAVHWHWSVFSLTINRAGYSVCPGPCRRISAPRLISCDWQLAFALIVRCWDCLLSKLHTPGLWLCCWLTWENNPGDFNANLSWENHATSPLQTNDLRARAIKYLNNLYQKLLGMFSVQIWFMPRY